MTFLSGMGGRAFQQTDKAALFRDWCTPFAKRRKRVKSLPWWNSDDGVAEVNKGRRHSIALLDMAHVIQMDEKTMRGSYAMIQKVRIEGCLNILPHWEFAAKKSIHQ